MKRGSLEVVCVEGSFLGQEEGTVYFLRDQMITIHQVIIQIAVTEIAKMITLTSVIKEILMEDISSQESLSLCFVLDAAWELIVLSKCVRGKPWLFSNPNHNKICKLKRALIIIISVSKMPLEISSNPDRQDIIK